MDYPALNNRIYLNYGGQGVLCRQTLEAIHQAFLQIEEQGCFSYANNEWFKVEIEKTKTAIARELATTPDTIALTENTTVGCNIALWSINWQRGDRLLLSDGEHPGVIAIAEELHRRFGVELDTFSVRDCASDEEILANLRAILTPATKMLCISHIIWNTGQIVPLQAITEISHQQGVLVAVDGAQSVGVLPVNLPELDVDFYAFTAHKWWCAPLGVGALYVNPKIYGQVYGTYVGWRGLEGSDRGAKFEVATSAYPLYMGLQTALATANAWGSQVQRYDRLTKLAQSLWQELHQIPKVACLQRQPPQCGLVTFTVQGKTASEVSRWLEMEHRIHIRAMPEPKCLRVSIHYLTQEQDIAYLLSILQQL
ncbi:MAG: aminotransferase class V-fold PLP-dependent enzyme [Pseudanabaenaceae cyanobacterium]